MAYKDKQEILAMITAFLVAFVFWVYVMGDKNPDQTRVIKDVPVNLVNQENIEQANLALMPNQQFLVDLTVTGKALDVFRVSSEDFKIEADMGGYLKKGDNNIIPVDIKSTPKGVNVVNKAGYPYTIRVRLDSLLIKSIPVVINIKGSAQEGYGNLDPITRPSEVLISGPASLVSTVTSAVGQVDVNGIADEIKETIPLRAQDKDGKQVQDIEVEPKNVDVIVPIKPSKEVPIVVRTTGALSDNKLLKSIKPKTDKILIIGDREEIDKINSIETLPIELGSITKSQSKDVQLNIPKNVVLNGNIKTVTVDINIENMLDKTFNTALVPQNESPDYNYAYSANTIDVVITGNEGLVNSIDPKTITAKMDLKGLGEGTSIVQVVITSPEGTSVKEFSPQKITVTITKK